ncbi:hypothetical protein PLESTF_001410100 [Pleodorina starrii]|nr:hypothetical protein PLESTM_001523500 [Pleodorina starrii]GLC73702.1 hypothetical protein PLESTF_001410100 [Pleodorina starrii]
MSFVQRGGGRLLARLVRGVSADITACSTSCPAPNSHLAIPTCLWSLSGVRRMAGGGEPSSRPPPPGSPAAQDGAEQPPQSPPAPGSAQPPQPSASTSAPAPPPKPAPSQPPPPASPSTSPSSATADAPGRGGAKASSSQASSAGGRRKRPDPASAPEPGSGTKDAAEESVHAYHDFWRDERVRKLQPMIEEGMRVTAYEGLQGIGGGLMRGPDRAWSYLYESPPAALAAAAFAPLWSASVLAVRQLVIPPTEGMIRDQVDHSFDAKEFAESVAQAVPVFFDAVAEGDREALARMCTPRAVEAVDRDQRRLREEMGLEVARIDTTVKMATLGGGNLWGPESVRAFDPIWAGSVSPATSKSWLVAAVYLDVQMWVTYRRVGGGGGGEDGGGEGGGRPLRTPVRRWGTWMMARGPLPKGPAESLDCPWKLLAWY